jgi:hypothetical protein
MSKGKEPTRRQICYWEDGKIHQELSDLAEANGLKFSELMRMVTEFVVSPEARGRNFLRNENPAKKVRQDASKK